MPRWCSWRSIPTRITYDQLLKTFWEDHDPTQGMRQGNDVGTQYRSIILTADDAQRATAEATRDAYQAMLSAAGYGRITTEIAPAGPFYHAEGYHQQYFDKNPAGLLPEPRDGRAAAGRLRGHSIAVRRLTPRPLAKRPSRHREGLCLLLTARPSLETGAPGLPCLTMEPDRRDDEGVADHPARWSRGGGHETRTADVLPLDRFNAFTDGVFAIAITLLVLELTVPAAGVPLLEALAEQWPEFLGYLISFVFIGGIWVSHAGMTKLMRHSDTLAYGIDLLMLLFVAVLPFSTNLMVSHLSGPDVEPAVVIYGVNLLLASLALSLLMFYIASERSLVLDGVADETLEAKVRQRWVLIGLNIAGIALAVVAPLAAVGVYVAMTFLALLRPLIHLRRRGKQ